MTSQKNSSQRSKWLFPLVWINSSVGVVFLIEIVGNPGIGARDLLRMLAYMLVYANLTGILAILSVMTIVQRLALRKMPLLLGVAVGVLVICPLGLLAVQTLLMASGLVVPQHFWPEYLHTLRTAMPLALVFGAGAFFHGSLRERLARAEAQLHEKELGEERMRKLAVEVRFRLLESRIHPHFLFNTLNSISALIAVDPTRAEQIVGRLAALLRASLDSGLQPLIPLREELAMVENYVDIERARFGAKLCGSVQVPVELMEVKVPPMSIQSLVENAVKHGITPQSGGGEFLVTAAAADGSLRVEVRDSGPGFDLAAIQAGHGLDSLVQRLDSLFGSRASLSVFRRNDYSIVLMVVPLAVESKLGMK